MRWAIYAISILRLHLSVTMLHTKPEVRERLVKHVEDAAAELMKSPGEKATGAVSYSFFCVVN